jgi:putative ABC transport system substrate-binding protein
MGHHRAARTRRRFLRASIAVAGAGLLAGCGLVPSFGRPPAKVPRVGMLVFYSNASALEPQVLAFLQGMQEAGYEDGRSVAYEYRFAEERPERLPALIAELIDANVDVIWTCGTPASIAARDATSTMPVVFVGGGDPVALGLIQSLAHPGRNLTGATAFSTTLNRKRLEILKEVAPRTSHVALLLDATSLLRTTVLDETRAAGETLGTKISAYEARTPDDCIVAFQAAKAAGADGLLVQPSPIFLRLRSQIAELARDSQLPGLYSDSEFTEVGGLLSYGPNAMDTYHRSASNVDKILKGAKPADVPVTQPTKFEFVINLKTARELGLDVPSSVMQQATQVIQ